MKKLLLLLVGAVALSGCASSAMPVTGLLYGNVKAPLTATASTEKATRVGRASARSILGIIASGDASIQTAAETGASPRSTTWIMSPRISSGCWRSLPW